MLLRLATAAHRLPSRRLRRLVAGHAGPGCATPRDVQSARVSRGSVAQSGAGAVPERVPATNPAPTARSDTGTGRLVEPASARRGGAARRTATHAAGDRRSHGPPAQQIQDDLAAAPDALGRDRRARHDRPADGGPPQPAAPPDRRAASRRVRVVALLSGLALVAAGGDRPVPTVVLPGLPVTPRAPGRLAFQSRGAARDGWQIVARGLTPRVELTELDPPGASGDPKKCVVTVHVAGRYDRRKTEPLETRPCGAGTPSSL